MSTNHLEAYDRIAKAIEDKIAEINVAPATLNVDLSGVIAAINNIKLTCNCAGGSTGGDNGSGNGGTPDLTKLIDKIDQLICVQVPIANSLHQIEKNITYWTIDGPQYGIDAPPGSFIFPKPNDVAPPLPYTPDTTTQIDPTTGAWLTPPIVEGIAYVAPPGGMQGESNITMYRDYKCDVAEFIYNYIVGWFDYVLEKNDTLDFINFEAGMIVVAVEALSQYLAFGSAGGTVIGTFAGVELVKGAVATGAVILTTGEFLVIAAILGTVELGLYVVGKQFENYRNLVVSQKEKVICALHKAKTSSQARDNVMIELNKYVSSIIDIGQGSFVQGAFIRKILSDPLLAMLFACQEGLDISTIAGMGAGNCVGCLQCEDTEEEITVNLASADFPTHGYYVDYEFGTHSVDVICCNVQSTFCNQPPRVNIYLNDLQVASGTFGTDNKPVNVSLSPPLTGVIPEGWDPNANTYTKWEGAIRIRVIAKGTVNAGNGSVRLNKVAWRNATP